MKIALHISTILLASAGLTALSAAADKVTLGYSLGATSMPYFVAVQQGYFEEFDLEVEPVVLQTGSLNQAALVANQIDVSSVLLAVEAMTANIAQPGAITYISLNAQNASHRMEQFVVREGYEAETLADLKGARIVSAPGVGNMTVAKAALLNAGLTEADFTLDQLAQDQHISVLQSDQYDAAYTLEPFGTVIQLQGVGRLIKAGVIAETVLGDPEAEAYMAGGAVSANFLNDRPEVLARFVEAWSKAIDFIAENPEEAKQTLVEYTSITQDVVAAMPVVLFTKAADIDPSDIANLQAYVDYAVEIGTVPQPIEVTPFIYAPSN